jgi:hypothetical protein
MDHHLKIADLLATKSLQGRPAGRCHFPQLCGLLTHVSASDTVLLDFAGIEWVTASWINEALAPLIDWAANARNDFFIVLVEFRNEWLDELAVVSDLNHKYFLVTSKNSYPKSATLVGRLDHGQRETLDAVLSSGETTGAMLEKSGINPSTQATAWNNRLRDLYAKRLLKRKKIGREQIYKSVVGKVSIYG